MSPPLRAKRHQDAIWNALATGQVSTVATDHAPFDSKAKRKWAAAISPKSPTAFPASKTA